MSICNLCHTNTMGWTTTIDSKDFCSACAEIYKIGKRLKDVEEGLAELVKWQDGIITDDGLYQESCTSWSRRYAKLKAENAELKAELEKYKKLARIFEDRLNNSPIKIDYDKDGNLTKVGQKQVNAIKKIGSIWHGIKQEAGI